MHPLTRRAFLEGFSAVATGAFAATRIPGAFAAAQSQPHVSFPTVPRDRIAIASYPFRAYIDSPHNRDRDSRLRGMDLPAFASEIVAKFNIRNLEPLDNHFRSLDPAYLAGLRASFATSGVSVVDIPVDPGNSFYDPNPAARAQAVASAKKWIAAAVILGSPSIRTHIRASRNSAPDVQRAAASLREVASHAAAKNVVVHLENDDLVTEDAFFIVKVIDAVNSPWLRALPDFANSMLGGNAGFNYRALTAMFQRAYAICHIKDGEVDDHGKPFTIDLQKSFDILKSANYRGYCSIEFDAPGDPYAPTAKLIDQTLHFIS